MIFEIIFPVSSRHMNHIRSNGNLAWIMLWLYVGKCFELRLFMSILDHAALNCFPGGAGLEDQMGQWVCNFLRSILNIIRLLENIRRYCTGWSSVNILAFHNFVEKFVTATALEILRQMLSQYLQVLITFRTFVHMNQSVCTSWCFIKSTQMLVYEAGWRPRLVHQS